MLEVVLNDPPQRVFFSGSEVSGKLKVRVNEPTRTLYKKIQVTLVGLAYVSWRVGQIRTFTSNEIYIKLSTIVWKKERTPTQELHVGINSFPFQFQIPADRLPSSFQGSTGWIRYYVEGRIDTTVPGRCGHAVKVPITVVENVDINVPQLQTALLAVKQKTLGCLFCASPPITLNVELPRRGFCCGDTIPLKATLENGSSRQLRLRAQLLQVIVYTAEGKYHKYTERAVASIASGQLEPRTTSTWNPDELLVPVDGRIVPTLRSCGIINLDYVLKVSAIIPWGLNLTVDITITIGNAPLHSSTSAPNPFSVISMVQPQFLSPPVSRNSRKSSVTSTVNVWGNVTVGMCEQAVASYIKVSLTNIVAYSSACVRASLNISTGE